MPVTKAQALVPGLALFEADPTADLQALDRLAFWMLQHYAPIVATDPPNGLVIDTTGADHLHGGEEAMLIDLVQRLAGAGITARAAIADHWGTAHAVARYGACPITIVPAGTASTAIAPLPIAALRLSKDQVTELRVLGFERISDLMEQPRAPVTLRFGPEPGLRLDQALGQISEPFTPIQPPDLTHVRQAFPEPIGAPETIARYTGKLATRLCRELAAKGLGGRKFDLLFHRVDNRLEAIRIGTAQPLRDVKRLTKLLCDRIETIDPGFGIETMVLAATLAEPLPEQQITATLTEENLADLSDLVDTLANRIGAHRLYRLEPVESDVPERSFSRVAPLAPELAPPSRNPWPEHWPRPARLLPHPEPIETIALLPDHPPVGFTWRGIRRRVKCADGPERIFGEWWKQDTERMAVRDYFRIEDEAGERYWIFRSGDGEDAATGSHRWFLHGIFG
ncbi:nucleotidyltransferase/DNA polymerase involved in DNA repair-like protein [Beijerinckia indica subsp. indica ATCC 9039]|uniref:Nucleotidyltransferase/DNA polymerase involved in DNA repair-like protein n=2 Tax=Beijerinckia TaxID=532 RepID=B2IJZ5_BEII9|nr:nucleotidyltransferase/DNA polymerase involved in DNA repair-like protein [Beijerinckia indica subsp. indica ATCC 9039]